MPNYPDCPAGTLAVLGLAAGQGAACAAAADILFLATVPLLGMYAGCSLLLQLHLRCLAASWGLLRGKVK